MSGVHIDESPFQICFSQGTPRSPSQPLSVRHSESPPTNLLPAKAAFHNIAFQRFGILTFSTLTPFVNRRQLGEAE